ncbi:hypothetical protein [Nostoc sp. PCC 7524]|uniref:hypothetical protein n=1 Tax=Nostoc sp. (strain ATCC 29411 / PCC 7524) TaxID=28072 RepID=UPI0005A20084|nr:hypothetical protein [Nostoc sp. PCC 7524]
MDTIDTCKWDLAVRIPASDLLPVSENYFNYELLNDTKRRAIISSDFCVLNSSLKTIDFGLYKLTLA